MNFVWLYVDGKCICSFPLREVDKTVRVLKSRGFKVEVKPKYTGEG
jgi:hypothetical protein